MREKALSRASGLNSVSEVKIAREREPSIRSARGSPERFLPLREQRTTLSPVLTFLRSFPDRRRYRRDIAANVGIRPAHRFGVSFVRDNCSVRLSSEIRLAVSDSTSFELSFRQTVYRLIWERWYLKGDKNN